MPRQRDDQLLRALGARLQAMRKERGLTQERLAEAMDIQPVTLSRLETGHRALSLSVLATAAAALECRLDELVAVERDQPAPARPPDEAELLRLYQGLDAAGRELALGLLREVVRHV